ncbi:putative Ulp1 protease family catalytic domain-containing protein [Rosa chinensis]|uniref:Putative Ulp1 protease family catalytic domain-containing protein n=1 Tax=Rosa chinensis TaxID=74649 RepID=A0A2P6QQG1_ROSCH|nr:putative Ulp1 protease family catalytic domain-containing protein [Rosa chinensis]
MRSWVAWPKQLIIRSLVKKPIKDNAKKKRKKKETADEDSEVQFSLASMAPTLPESLKMLCQWGEDKFRDGRTISFHIEPEVFGYSRKTFLMGSDVRQLASMRELSGTCIAVYQRYLYEQLIAYKMVDMVAFIDPSLIGASGSGNRTVRAQHIRDRLVTAKPGQMFMLPYNSCDHWMLTIVNPNQGTAYFLDPLKRRLPTGDWMSIVETALGMYNSERKRKGRSSVMWKNLAGIPPQPSNKECGYFIMRYMRDIIEDKDLSLFLVKWERRGSSHYTQADINQMRNEWAKFVVKAYV